MSIEQDSYDLLLPQTEAWAERHAGEMAGQIDENVRAALRTEITNGLTEGLPWRDVRQRIVDTTGLDSWRAGRIARTEVIRAHAEGTVEAYKASGNVRGIRWADGQTGACPKCRELHNKVVALGEVFYSDPKFGDGLPPRHPNCRCAIRPVTLEQVKRLPEGHLLKENRRNTISELTDKDTYVNINGFTVTGGAKRHWTIRHGKQISSTEIETAIIGAINSGNVFSYTTEGEKRYYLSTPIGTKSEFYIPVKPTNSGGWEIKTIYKRRRKK